MKLTDLNPSFIGHGGEGVSKRLEDGTLEPIPYRAGVAISFDCPCGECGEKTILNFKNPISGGETISPHHPCWERTGDNFEVMSLTPSIQRMGKCRWHGYLTNGELKEC